MNNSAESFVFIISTFITLMLLGAKTLAGVTISWFWVFFPLLLCFGIVVFCVVDFD